MVKTDRAIFWFFAATTWLVPLVFVPQLTDGFELPKAAIFRTLVLGILVLMFFRKKVERPKFDKIFGWLLVGLLMSFVLSTLFSVSPHISFWGSYERQQGLLTVLFYFLFFGAFVSFFRKKADIWRLVSMMCYGAFAVSLIALFQVFSEEVRIYGTIGQPNFLGVYLMMIVPFIFLVKPRGWKVILTFVLVAIAFTLSRSAFVGLFAGTILYAFLSDRKRILLVHASLVSTVVLMNIFSGFFASNVVLSRFVLDSTAFESAKIRLEIWPMAVEEIFIRPVLGYGPEMMSEGFDDFEFEEEVDRAHNEILDTAVSLGLVGLIIYMGLLVRAFWIGNKRRGDVLVQAVLISMVSLFAANMFSFSVTVHYVFWWINLGILTVVCAKDFVSVKLFRGFRYLALAGFVAVIFTINVRPLVADYFYQRGIEKMIVLNHFQASEDFRRASEWNPNEVQYLYMGAEHLVLVAEDYEGEVREKIVARGEEFLEKAKNLAGDLKKVRDLEKDFTNFQYLR